MNKIAVAKELLGIAKELVAIRNSRVAGTLNKADFVALVNIMKNTGVSKNSKFVNAIIGWLKDMNPLFDVERFKEELE